MVVDFLWLLRRRKRVKKQQAASVEPRSQHLEVAEEEAPVAVQSAWVERRGSAPLGPSLFLVQVDPSQSLWLFLPGSRCQSCLQGRQGAD